MIIVPTFYKEVILYVLVPLFIALAIFGSFLIFYNRKAKKDIYANYRLNYWGSIIGIIFGAILLSVAIGFSVSFVQRIYYYNLVSNYLVLTVFLYVFPFIPLAFLIFFIYQLVMTIKNRPREDED